MLAMVQVMEGGGEEELHSHPALDGFWFVLSGRVRFYGEGDAVIAELGRHEGVFIPRTTKYWFEQVGDEHLELLQVEAIDRKVENRMDRHDNKPASHADFFEPEGALIASRVQLSD